MRLRVRKIEGSETFKDRVRIPYQYRDGISEGAICKLSTSKKSKLVEIRGKKKCNRPHIFMDLATRRFFGLKVGSFEQFSLREVGRWGQFIWASKAADVPTKVAAQLGLISLALGVLSLVLGLVPLFK